MHGYGPGRGCSAGGLASKCHSLQDFIGPSFFHFLPFFICLLASFLLYKEYVGLGQVELSRAGGKTLCVCQINPCVHGWEIAMSLGTPHNRMGPSLSDRTSLVAGKAFTKDQEVM